MAKQKSDLSRALTEDGANKTHVGGQALLEGVMMRGKYNWAVGVRTPEGDVYTEEHDLASGKKTFAWLMWPFIRGCYALIQSLILGFKALEVAANHAFTDEEIDESERGSEERSEGCEASERNSSEPPSSLAPSFEESEEEKEPFFGKGEMALSMILGLVLGVGLFIVAPAVVTNFVVGEYDSNPVMWNIFDGVLRVAIFILYIWLIGRMQDIKRMFSYHGAEHKTIHCYEHGLPLTPENARQFPCLHVRCGTAFMIMVMLIAIFVYTAIPLKALFTAWGVPDGAPKLLLVIATRIIFMPIIAGISYEITVKWAGSRPEHPLVKIILWPGLQMQRLTTNEPDDGMLECAIAAMKIVLEREEREAAKELAEQGARG